ncbi:MAG: zinc-binding alcohol dehydrogenase family protein [Bdellovibrionales bacterium]|nr:zinc-binding alcohol dehydrogenase family protein [Bdellovibrionales bacterium]
MKALGHTTPHLIADFSIKEYDLPKPAQGPLDLLVEVKAVSVNPVDCKVRASRVAPDEKTPIILGWDASGVVVAIGPSVSGFKIGDEVYYSGELLRSGSNAEFQAVDHRIVALKPKRLSFAEAAAMPLTTITAYEALIENRALNLSESSTVLIIGGAGGVGSMAIQILKTLTKAKVIATASRQKTVEWCKNLGADYVIDHSNDLKTELKNININEVDVVFSTTHSSDYIPMLNEIIKPFGNFILIDDPKELNIAHFKQKSIATSWEFMFTKSMFAHHPEEQGKLLKEIATLVDAGLIKTTLRETYIGMTIENLKKAHETLEASKSFGKIVLTYER